MITVGVIRSGATYLASHLRKNDYWAEGEKEVEGEWIGLSAQSMNLQGPVTAAPFEALRLNRHPETGEPLTPRDALERTAFFDIQLSAPKDVSVLAMVGGDERVKAAFVESVHCALREMERYAAVRERRGDAATSEEFRLTGNYVGAVFFHDASRDLDPQLHAHAVLANVTFDPARKQWMALQPAEMLRASPYLRQVLYRELGSRLRALGYEVENMSAVGFNLKGLKHLRARFSKRSKHVEQLAQEFAQQKGRQPTKKEREILVRDSREQKLTKISTDLVRQRQRAQLTESEMRDLQALITRARPQPLRPATSLGNPREIIDSALRHVYERVSVAREGLIYATALSLHPHFNRWQELRPVLENMRTPSVRSTRRAVNESRSPKR
ncbi:MAG: MobF family relaxase [Opitutaceae bacterium]|nr:MobF family relaxase [Opitutaceae bacterium]